MEHADVMGTQIFSAMIAMVIRSGKDEKSTIRFISPTLS